MTIECPLCRCESANFTIEDTDTFSCCICFSENCARKAKLSCNHPDLICEKCITEIANTDLSVLSNDNIFAVIWGIATAIDPLYSLSPIRSATHQAPPSQPSQAQPQNLPSARIPTGPNSSLRNNFRFSNRIDINYINYDISI